MNEPCTLPHPYVEVEGGGEASIARCAHMEGVGHLVVLAELVEEDGRFRAGAFWPDNPPDDDHPALCSWEKNWFLAFFGMNEKAIDHHFRMLEAAMLDWARHMDAESALTAAMATAGTATP